MVDWKGFQKVADRLAKSYTVKDVKISLIMLDPGILVHYSFLWRLLARLGITQFRFGRDLCFGTLFTTLLKKNPNLFTQAPPEVVTTFNNLVTFLFSEKVARKLFVSTQVHEEMLARLRENLPYEKRLQLFLRQSTAFQDLQSQAAALPQANHTVDITDHQRTLVELEQILDERLAKLDDLKKKKEVLFSTISKLPTAKPACFNGRRQEAWDKIFLTLSPYFKIAEGEMQSFANGEQFTAWMTEELRLFDEATKAAEILKAYKSLEKEIPQFVDGLHDVTPYLIQKHVQGYLEVVEEELLQGETLEQIRQKMKEQTAHVLHLNRLIKENFDKLKTNATPFFQKLFVAEFIPYRDLPKEADRILTEPFQSSAVHSQALSPEEYAKYEAEITEHAKEQLKKIEHLLEVAKTRTKKLHEMEEFQRAFLQIINQVRYYKDLHEDFVRYDEKAQKLSLSKQDLTKATFQEIEHLVQERIKHYEEFRAQTPSIMRALATASQRSERRSLDDKLAIKRRLFEIFWNISPYLDLAENVAALRETLTRELKESIVKFYQGELTSSEFLFACQEMPYEHDVVKLRNEITHRASRLKDLRDEAIRIAREVSNFRRLLEIAGLQHERAYRDFVSHKAEIFQILQDIENPFIAFSKATTKDEINYVFRNLWIRIEELQAFVEKSKEEAVGFLKKSAVALKGSFLRALVSLEELFQLKEATRLSLVSQSERELNLAPPNELFEAVLAQIHGIEKRFRFCQPFTFYMLIGDHQMRLKLFQEAYSLDEKLESVVSFAKSMQYVKTFEEERVDVILEAFERRYLLEDEKNDPATLDAAWKRYQKRMQRTLTLVLDEVFLDIGLLDRHGLMDVDQQTLNKTLIQAIERARQHVSQLLLPLSESSHLMCQKTTNDLKKNLDEWVKIAIPESSDTDALLEHLRSFCHLLFDVKVLQAAFQGMLIPKCLKLMNDLRSLSRYLEEWLQEKRGERKAIWGIPWIPECYAIRSEIETFEPTEESANAFRPVVKKVLEIIQQIPEVSYLKATDGDPLQLATINNELSAHLEEIDLLAQDTKREHPFIYIPGYLAFFGSASS